MTKKMVSFRMDTKLLEQVNKLEETKTTVIERGVAMYLQSLENVNTPHKENVNTIVNTAENELFTWLKDKMDRVEYTQDRILEKINGNGKKEAMASWFRM